MIFQSVSDVMDFDVAFVLVRHATVQVLYRNWVEYSDLWTSISVKYSIKKIPLANAIQ